jgi:hypothetical protein
MDFPINQNSLLPVLKLELINDGRNNFHHFYEKIQNATITFTMVDVETGVVKVAKQPASIFFDNTTSEYCEEYTIGYVWKRRDTSKVGKYRGLFEIEFQDGSGPLIVPIKEELYINIMEGVIKI